uniref:ADAM metallopeptidase domain 8b n=1 Tax=Eptatretus burgeri TaxID=7764 RepID=A0A8C4QZD8_EPTBU
MYEVPIRCLVGCRHNIPRAQRFAIRAEGRPLVLRLHKNEDLLSSGFTEVHYLENGTRIASTSHSKDHCLYHGDVEGVEGSDVSLSTCAGLSGLVTVSNTSYILEPLEDSVEGKHITYPLEHAALKLGVCGVKENKSVILGMPRLASVRHPDNEVERLLLTETKYVSLMVVADKEEYIRMGRDRLKLKQRVLDIANHIDKLYRPLKTRIALVGLEIWTDHDKISVSSNPETTLHQFLSWRSKNLLLRKRHSNAQLITGIDFDGATVGLAPIGTMCSTMQSGAVNQDHSRNAVGVATTMAHEMGHNFGMQHDLQERGCHCSTPDHMGGCILKPNVGSQYPHHFSSCSENDYTDFLIRGTAQCLLKPPASHELYGGAVCGNLFLDDGEDCDCGSEEECINPCCDARTCRLKPGAQCAQGSCCHSCKIKKAGEQCREAKGDCDLPEVCDGQSSDCPANLNRMDGTPCHNGQAYCFNGACPLLNKQCQMLWGSGSSVAEDICFEKVNIGGNRYGNCGIMSIGYVPCQPKDVRCGKLQCTGGSQFPVTGSTMTMTLTQGFQSFICKIAGSESDNDHTNTEPDQATRVVSGTKCGNGKMCVDGTCLEARSLQVDECTASCNGHGVCNNKKQCHCDEGWFPPFCSSQTAGIPLQTFPPVVTVLSGSWSTYPGFTDYEFFPPASSPPTTKPPAPAQTSIIIGAIVGAIISLIVIIAALILIQRWKKSPGSLYTRNRRIRSPRTHAPPVVASSVLNIESSCDSSTTSLVHSVPKPRVKPQLPPKHPEPPRVLLKSNAALKIERPRTPPPPPKVKKAPNDIISPLARQETRPPPPNKPLPTLAFSGKPSGIQNAPRVPLKPLKPLLPPKTK